MNKAIEQFDARVITFIKKISFPFARVAMSIIFVWFGVLKVLGNSPANGLVLELFNNTFLHIFNGPAFLVGFGIFEMLLGILVLIPRLERVTFLFLFFHLTTTVMPLFILTDVTWQGFLVPTLIGQYIIKNVALLAIELVIIAHLTPMTKTHRLFSK
jgi:uncharacterized membrane protein YkgB